MESLSTYPLTSALKPSSSGVQIVSATTDYDTFTRQGIHFWRREYSVTGVNHMRLAYASPLRANMRSTDHSQFYPEPSCIVFMPGLRSGCSHSPSICYRDIVTSFVPRFVLWLKLPGLVIAGSMRHYSDFFQCESSFSSQVQKLCAICISVFVRSDSTLAVYDASRAIDQPPGRSGSGRSVIRDEQRRTRVWQHLDSSHQNSVLIIAEHVRIQVQ